MEAAGVKKLYSDEHAISDMRDYTKKKLKIWENEVVSYFPAKSWVLDIGCGLEANYSQYLDGKKFFAYADTDCYWESFTIDEIIE